MDTFHAPGEPESATRYNSFFQSEDDARWFQALLSLARQGEPRPFPGDEAKRPVTRQLGSRDLFVALKAVDLSAFASKYTSLRQIAQDRWKGLCPLHPERTASFYVFANPWRWRCFGACASGGDIVDFARELKARGIRK